MTVMMNAGVAKQTIRGQGVPKKKAPSSKKQKSLMAISLFSGGGGLDLGAHQAGFSTLTCIEVDPYCCETLRHNQTNFFPKVSVINSDVRLVSPLKLMRDLDLAPGDLDLLFGGPPCQSFSQIGKQDSLSDDRGMLLFEMIRFAKVFKPKAILIENVKALVNAKNLGGERGGVLRELLVALNKAGYTPHAKVLNSAHYGVAQARERLFVVALRKGMEFEFPPETHGPNVGADYVTVREALKGLRKPLGRDQRLGLSNHVDVTPEGDRKRIAFVDEGSYLFKANAPLELKGTLTKKDTTKYLRLDRAGVSNTLRCGEIFFHPTDDRYLTPREYMRLHGFPDDYALRGPIRGRSGRVRHLDQHRQVANSVPPPLASVVIGKIKKVLNENG